MNDKPATVPRSLGLLVASAIAAAGTVLGAIRAPLVINEFRELYQGFGADVTAGTKFLLNFPYVWWVFAAASVAVFLWVGKKSQVTPTEDWQMKLAFRILIGLTGAALGFAVYALYVPIFKLGAAV